MSVEHCVSFGWIPSDLAHPGKTISTITTPTYDRMGGAMHIRVVRCHRDPVTGEPSTIVLADVTDTTSVGFGAQVLTINQPVTNIEPISIQMERTDRDTFAIDNAMYGTVTYV